MILVIGGLASGKRDFIKTEYGYSDKDMADAVINECPVLFNLQDLVAARLADADTLLPDLLEKQIVICNEVGCGIVPIDKADRAAREATGRLCLALAQKAEKVVRVYCGIPTAIKE